MKKSFLRKISFMMSSMFTLVSKASLVNVSVAKNNDEGTSNVDSLLGNVSMDEVNSIMTKSQTDYNNAVIFNPELYDEVDNNKSSLLSNIICTCTMQDDMISTWSSRYGIVDYNVSEMFNLSAMVK
ncbi:hypothetical protein [Clostridium saccharobutylicum]|uniref:Uncharacterized protein n=1 Tax=Clostridium saccharobutylicum DSM 13864 TaxID=1345695 RepID=U5MV73_CLOSA|nr:hypothetical protein [Clostridium saccharobutylicum]AGX44704.1 hypothetical protein CLSA_c37430 [Clostridium saccharobutylicum DSM 13864]MBA2903485.1 hypothetical protein [Clostridium saccharobutylicum]MBA8788316.1 hypothetical protein [Clostridium saccharobutylicum]MBA8894995.1 hypothetical protein [Clostridium saccharobutylicum]MBA8984096.1 hypothetical protein [Clostridium saccharobutylicum]